MEALHNARLICLCTQTERKVHRLGTTSAGQHADVLYDDRFGTFPLIEQPFSADDHLECRATRLQ